MRTHIFIVDINTFKYHLEYLFAWTWAKDYVIDFNNSSNTKLKAQRENLLWAMIADLERVRKWDYIIFYLQQSFSNKVKEWKFYWIFKVKSEPFLDNNTDDQFLKSDLDKSLTFRVLLEPHEVYSEWVTEWEALDEIKNISSPNQMLWSLIYRKLKWNRWNTMITIYESEKLFRLIKDKNSKNPLESKYFSFDIDNQRIISIKKGFKYSWKQEKINILPRLISKFENNRAFESQLQAYIVQNIWKNTNKTLDATVLWDRNWNDIEWIWNEVSCWVWMQRIDVMLSLWESENRVVIPIELKAVRYSSDNLRQIQRYIDWLQQYYIPNRVSDIQPVLITKTWKKAIEKTFIEEIKSFNKKNSNYLPLKFIEFDVKENWLEFFVLYY